jgi:hypothetical protein
MSKEKRMRAARTRPSRLAAWLTRAFENPATNIIPPLRDYPVAVSRRVGPPSDGW